MGATPKSRPSTPKGAPVRLNSWKQIAAYLDRDPRTVQLWEKEEGLPVHRLNHHARPSVYAYADEIDAWLEARSQAEAAGDANARPRAAQSAKSPAKHVYEFAALLFAVLLPAVAWIARRRQAPIPASASTLAVLPFENQTTAGDYFADGLTSGVISDLGRIGKVRVISLPSMLSFKSHRLQTRQVAAELRASLVLLGAVVQTGNQIQVTVELVNPVRNAHLWSATYNSNAGNLLTFQHEVASQVAMGVTRRVTGSAPPMVFPHGTVDPRARQAYLAGRAYWNQHDLRKLQKAIVFFRQAIAIDPQYPQAYARLAESYDLIAGSGVLSDAEAFHRAKASARIALTLDPSSAPAYNALALATYQQDWDFFRAEHYFQRAVELNPDYAVAHQWYGNFLTDMLRFDQSIAELRMANELDPLSPTVGSDLADGYLHAGRLTDADAELKRVLGFYPDFIPADLYRIRLYTRQGDLAAAETEAKIYLQRSGDETPWRTIEVQRLAAGGNLDRARAEVHRLISGTHSPPFDSYCVAQLLFAAGEKEAGYRALEEAYREHSWRLTSMLVDPSFEPVRNEPHFRDLARRVGLPNLASPPAAGNQRPSS